MRHFIETFPDEIVVRNYKVKERAVADFVKTQFPNLNWVCDKNVKGSKKRPDLLLQLESHVLIVEIDEEQHNQPFYEKDHLRQQEIWEAVDYQDLIFIRFNPDEYTDSTGTVIKSCWVEDDNKKIHPVPETWNSRLATLKSRIEHWLINQPIDYQNEWLFYDSK